MEGNTEFQFFVDNIKRDLWNALGGKYEVCISMVSGANVNSAPVIVVKKAGEPDYMIDVPTAFYECSKKYEGDIKRYTLFLSFYIAKRNAFLLGKDRV